MSEPGGSTLLAGRRLLRFCGAEPGRGCGGLNEWVDAMFRAESGKPLVRTEKRPLLRI